MNSQPLCCHGARHVRYARDWYAYPVRAARAALGGRPPCASGAACSTREAGTRRLYVPYGGPRACVSAESGASVCPAFSHALGAPSGEPPSAAPPPEVSAMKRGSAFEG